MSDDKWKKCCDSPTEHRYHEENDGLKKKIQNWEATVIDLGKKLKAEQKRSEVYRAALERAAEVIGEAILQGVPISDIPGGRHPT